MVFVDNMDLSLQKVDAAFHRHRAASWWAERCRERTMEEVCKQTVRPAGEFVTACFRTRSAETARYQFLTPAPRGRYHSGHG
jgi:hypothetical protein